MTDMLVKLYDLPPLEAAINRQTEQSITIRRAIPPEKHHVLAWVKHHFSPYWVSECDIAFTRTPPTCFLATANHELVGFACYDVTRLGFFGPTGVSEAARGKGTGAALLLACLHAMWSKGYGYAIIGGVGPEAFYHKIVGAVTIPDSTPGVYSGMLRQSPETEV